MQYLIGVDLGTTATKAVLFEKNGKIVASSSQAYPIPSIVMLVGWQKNLLKKFLKQF